MIKKTIILILLSTLFVSCNEGTRYDEPDVPITTNGTSIGNTPDNRPSLVDSVEKILFYEKTYKVSKCYDISVSIADILSIPNFVGVSEITVYNYANEFYKRFGTAEYHKEYKTYYDELNSNIVHSPNPSYTIPEDSILRVYSNFLYLGEPQDFVVIVKYEVKVKVKVPKSRIIGAD